MSKKIDKNKIRRIVPLFFVSIIILNLVLTTAVDAIKVIKDSVTRDAITEMLEDAAYMNIVANTLKKCINGGKLVSYTTEPSTRRGYRIIDGDVFANSDGIILHDTTYSTSLTIEDMVQGNGGDDGAIWCYQGTDKGKNIFQLYAKVMKNAGISMKEILCDGNNPGMFKRTDNKNCDSFSDDADSSSWCILDSCYYWTSPGTSAALAHMEKVYNKFLTKVDNPYMPSWDEIGKFNNVDGYFLYIQDFNKMCDADKVGKDSDQKQPVVIINRENKKITFERSYYHVTTSKTWEHSISGDNPVTSCSGFLDRIEELRKISNEVEARSGGYQGIITAELKRACKEAKDSEGNNAWETAKTKLNEILADDTNPEDLLTDAQTTLDELTAIMTADVYVKTDGNIDTSDNMTIECIEPEAFNIDVAAYTPVADPDDLDPNATSEASCYDNAGSLGWVLCPIIDQVSNAIVGIYDKYIVDFLQLEPGLFEEGSGTYQVWQQFLVFADIGFAIIFIIIIFSQLTGMGIDNYGIKKILPKLIISAILINLSYVICQLVVDISNIVGYGIGSIFDQFVILDPASVSVGGNHMAGTVAATSILIVLVVILAGGAILAAGPAAIVPILLGLLSIILAVIFGFIILAVRKSFAVILVAISPLAFVCYMLPNTKPLYTKWFNAFKAVLIAFPVCSAMIHGGQLVSRIMISAGGSTDVTNSVALAAAVMSVVPIFMIPKVIQGSMGAISSGILAARNKINGTARGKIERSGFAADMQRRGQMWKAGITVDNDGNVRLNKRGELQNSKFASRFRTKGGQQRLDMARRQAAQANAQLLGAGGASMAALTTMQQSAMAAKQEQEVKDIEAAIGLGNYSIDGKSISVYDNESLKGGLTAALKKGDKNQVKALQNILYGKGEDGRKAAHEAVSAAQGQGADQEAIKAFGQNAMDKWAKDLKSNARSDFEFAKSASSGDTLKNIDSYRAIDKADKFTAENMASMDDSQIDNLKDAVNGKLYHVDADMQLAAARAAYEATTNDNIDLKGERREALEEIASHYDAETKSFIPTPKPELTEMQKLGKASPRKEGESTEEWGARLRKKKLVMDNPRKDGESTAEWGARIRDVQNNQNQKK